MAEQTVTRYTKVELGVLWAILSIVVALAFDAGIQYDHMTTMSRTQSKHSEQISGIRSSMQSIKDDTQVRLTRIETNQTAILRALHKQEERK